MNNLNLNNNHSFNIELAQVVGIEKAILLGRVWIYIDYHKRNGTNFIDNRVWMYDSSSALAEVYPYMTAQSIRRRMVELENDGWLISGNYNKRAGDLTKWYALGQTFINWIKDGKVPAQNEQANKKDLILEEISPAQNERATQEEIFPAQNERPIAQIEQAPAQNEQPLPIISNYIPVVAVGIPTAAPEILQGEELEEWIKLRYRHWFNKVDPHFYADVDAVQKAIIATYTQDILQSEVLEIVDNAFKRVVQEKPKKDWLTREVLIRIKWGLEDYFKVKEKEAAKAKKEAIESLKPGDDGLWNPSKDNVFKELLRKTLITDNEKRDELFKMFDDKPKEVSTVDKNSLDYRRRQSLFNQAVDEGK